MSQPAARPGSSTTDGVAAADRAAGGGTPTLRLRNVRQEYAARAGRTVVFDGIDLDVRPGEFVSVVGRSGCGKTTLLKLAHGLLRPTSGDVLLDGRPVADADPGDVAMVFQQDALLPWRTVRRNVSFGAEMARPRWQRARIDEARVDALLKTVGLDHVPDHHPRELSGGMRQRVNLARALYVQPRVLLMDEPFASLDAQTQEQMQAELLRIWAEQRITVLFVTHRLEEAVYLSDRVVVLSQRPTTVDRVIEIDLPRPRPLEVKRSVRFNELVGELTDALRDGDGA